MGSGCFACYPSLFVVGRPGDLLPAVISGEWFGTLVSVLRLALALAVSVPNSLWPASTCPGLACRGSRLKVTSGGFLPCFTPRWLHDSLGCGV